MSPKAGAASDLAFNMWPVTSCWCFPHYILWAEPSHHKMFRAKNVSSFVCSLAWVRQHHDEGLYLLNLVDPKAAKNLWWLGCWCDMLHNSFSISVHAVRCYVPCTCQVVLSCLFSLVFVAVDWLIQLHLRSLIDTVNWLRLHSESQPEGHFKNRTGWTLKSVRNDVESLLGSDVGWNTWG